MFAYKPIGHANSERQAILMLFLLTQVIGNIFPDQMSSDIEWYGSVLMA